jgi:hypothetical protein
MRRRLVSAVVTAIVIASLGAGSVLGGEITGNGKSLKVTDSKWGTGLHARSECAFSGQEDLQYPPYSDPTAGHAQSWGQIPKAGREFLTNVLHMNPGLACNPIK